MKSNTEKNIFSNIVWLFFDKGYGAVLTLFIYSLMAKYFGTESFGVWNYIIAFSSIIPAFAGLGINFIIVKKIRETPRLETFILANSFTLRLVAGVVFSVILLIIYIIIGINSKNEYLEIVALIFVSQIILNTNVFIFKNEADLKNKKTVIARNIALTIAFALRFYGIKSQLGLVFFAFTNVIEYFLFITVSFWFFKQKNPNTFKLILDKKMSFFLLKAGLPLLFSAITVVLYLKIDQLIIAYLMDNKSVGVYAASSRISEMLYAVPVIISNVFFPKIVSVKNNFIKRDILLNNLYGIVIIVTLFISVLVSYFSESIIYYLYGESYMESTKVLVIYSWSLLFMGLLVTSSKLLLVINRNDIILKRSIMGLVANIVLNFVLIPKMGIVGAAWATLISYSISAYFANIFFKDLRPVMLHQLRSVFSVFSNKS